ncbi:autophagocytosis associated protein [Limtongia smithiae]|uniref:autophagocytosis associated protein n=1 Tax=Limtongia smithiae TaxID=1125753 RepID=UPI0034CE0FF6
MLRLHSTFSSLREYLSPVSHVSTFTETGEITPEEFVAAGDFLVYKFPTWSWSAASPSKRRDFLPADKQFLVTKHVPSHARAQASAGAYGVGSGGAGGDDDPASDEADDEDGWTISYKSHASRSKSGPTPTGTKATTVGNCAAHEDEQKSDDEILDIDEMDDDDDDNDMEERDLEESGYLPPSSSSRSATNPSRAAIAAMPDRSYNLYIAYSTSYRVPKMYLSGFNASGGPLTPTQMFEDIVSEYKDRTVTIETSPFLEHTTMVSIHPCRHASVMKMLIARADARQRRIRAAQQEQERARLGQEDLMAGMEGLGLDTEEWEELTTESADKDAAGAAADTEQTIRVDQYLIIFLKFISSVTPGIEHDNTMAAL